MGRWVRSLRDGIGRRGGIRAREKGEVVAAG